MLLRLILFIYIELFFTALFILQLRHILFLGNLYIHVKFNAPLNGFFARDMA